MDKALREEITQVCYYHKPLNTVQALLEEGADVNYFSGHQSLLLFACENGIRQGAPEGHGVNNINPALIKLLLDAGANPNGLTTQDSQTPLYVLVRNSTDHWKRTNRTILEVIRELIAKGVDVNLHGRKDQRKSLHAPGRDGDLPISYAVFLQNNELFSTLLAAGANPSGVNYSGNYTIKQYLACNLQPHSHYPKIKVYVDNATKPIYDKLVEIGAQ
ncbi:MAG: hypothetical protein NTZ68_03885 [Candidatus Dependentiae bacterium]|nr:hypothetical protein [Candidatus Dependentiae bacterium]